MSPELRIDLNADLGESFGRWRLGEDEALVPVITSANVACGFHAGDPLTLRRTCATAAAAGVAIGAQVGYRDLAGFGRRFIDIAVEDLEADVLFQLGALQAMAAAAGSRVSYLKPHGALYHATIDHEDQAAAVVAAVVAFGQARDTCRRPATRSRTRSACTVTPRVRSSSRRRSVTASSGPASGSPRSRSDHHTIQRRTIQKGSALTYGEECCGLPCNGPVLIR